MKALKTRTFLVLHILTALSVMAALIGFIFCDKLMVFWPAIWGFMNHGDAQLPIILGVAPLSLLAYFLSFLFTYLVFEFYGFKQGFYNTVGIASAMAASFGVFWLLKKYGLDRSNPDYDDIFVTFLVQGRRFTVASMVAVLGGFTTCLIIAAGIKKLMRDYFMFIRYPIAGILGWAVFVILYTYISYFGILAPESMLFYAVTPAAQSVILVIGSVVPLYLLRLVFGFFRGWAGKNSETPDTRKRMSFFKTATPTEVALPAKSEQEDTVSERIKLTQALAKH